MVQRWPFYSHFRIWAEKLSLSKCNIVFDFEALILKLYMILMSLSTCFKIISHYTEEKNSCALFRPFFAIFANLIILTAIITPPSEKFLRFCQGKISLFRVFPENFSLNIASEGTFLPFSSIKRVPIYFLLF